MGAGERAVRALVVQAGFRSLTAAARASGVSRDTLRFIACGARDVTPATLERVALALRVSVAMLERMLNEARAEHLAREARP